MANGALTATMAHALARQYEPQGFVVLHDHRQPGADPTGKLGKPKSWFGEDLAAAAILADLDIVIAHQSTGRALALIEIEETTNKPKVLLGDVLATLLGDHISFQHTALHVGPWTSLIVLARSTHPTHQKRIEFLEERANHLKSALDTPNARVGKVVLRGFKDEPELAKTLTYLMETIIAQANDAQPESS